MLRVLYYYYFCFVSCSRYTSMLSSLHAFCLLPAKTSTASDSRVSPCDHFPASQLQVCRHPRQGLLTLARLLCMLPYSTMSLSYRASSKCFDRLRDVPSSYMSSSTNGYLVPFCRICYSCATLHFSNIRFTLLHPRRF